ncbi:MAG: hypothetical protein ACOC3T_04445 [Bacteroidota bacterium]
MTSYSCFLGKERPEGGEAATNKPIPNYINTCYSERCEESHFSIINETFFIG